MDTKFATIQFIFISYLFKMMLNSEEDLVSRAKKLFQSKFEREPTIITCAPGRINFGGEHCDYMGGYVLPFPTTLVGVAAGIPRPGKVIIRCTYELIAL